MFLNVRSKHFLEHLCFFRVFMIYGYLIIHLCAKESQETYQANIEHTYTMDTKHIVNRSTKFEVVHKVQNGFLCTQYIKQRMLENSNAQVLFLYPVQNARRARITF